MDDFEIVDVAHLRLPYLVHHTLSLLQLLRISILIKIEHGRPLFSPQEPQHALNPDGAKGASKTGNQQMSDKDEGKRERRAHFLLCALHCE